MNPAPPITGLAVNHLWMQCEDLIMRYMVNRLYRFNGGAG